MSSIHFTSLSIEQACERIAALRFQAIDIRSPHAGCPHLDDAQDRLGPDGLKRVLEDTKLEPYAWSVCSGGFAKYADFIGAMGGGVAVRGNTRPHPPEEMTQRIVSDAGGFHVDEPQTHRRLARLPPHDYECEQEQEQEDYFGCGRRPG